MDLTFYQDPVTLQPTTIPCLLTGDVIKQADGSSYQQKYEDFSYTLNRVKLVQGNR